jgi:hypothetical protein
MEHGMGTRRFPEFWCWIATSLESTFSKRDENLPLAAFAIEVIPSMANDEL